jgi:hypothetical protein
MEKLVTDKRRLFPFQSLRVDRGTEKGRGKLCFYGGFKEDYALKREKVPKRITGLEGVYSLKRLAEA